jgi:hypothetical protein
MEPLSLQTKTVSVLLPDGIVVGHLGFAQQLAVEISKALGVALKQLVRWSISAVKVENNTVEIDVSYWV